MLIFEIKRKRKRANDKRDRKTQFPYFGSTRGMTDWSRVKAYGQA